ncbi:6315_t:CDS:2, partial [Dentiscutata heterogama]
LERLSEDKRKREWVLVNKDNDETIVGKISKKLKTKVLIDHWVGQDRSENVTTLVKCRSCKLNGQVSILEEVVGYRANSEMTAVNSTEEEVASI